MDIAELETFLEEQGKPFDTFANALAKEEIAELAPPFGDYATYPGDLLDYYHDFFERYRKHLDKIDAEVWSFINLSMKAFVKRHGGHDVLFNIREEVENLMDAILSSSLFYLNGSPCGAYEKLEQVLISNDCHLLNILPQIQFSGTLYRVRNQRGLDNQKELFHTPFELRNSCGSYRFSILGYPSLYLACSLSTALAESHIDSEEYSAMGFRNGNALQCVDLSLPNRDLCFWERYSLVLFYPLIVACGLHVRDDGKPFKPEYVIPQILFQIVKEHSSLQGISYTSTRVPSPDYRNFQQRNFVLIVPEANMPKGQSKELANIFKCSKPLSPNIGEDAVSFENRIRSMEFYNMIL